MSGYRVLVVDDELWTYGDFFDLLRKRGCIVRTARKGEEALKLLEKQRYDAVILDVVLPGMDGLEVLRRMRQQKAMARTPVAVLTIHRRGSRTAVQAMQDGYTLYIEKGISVDAMLREVERMLSQLGGREEGQPTYSVDERPARQVRKRRNRRIIG